MEINCCSLFPNFSCHKTSQHTVKGDDKTTEETISFKLTCNNTTKQEENVAIRGGQLKHTQETSQRSQDWCNNVAIYLQTLKLDLSATNCSGDINISEMGVKIGAIKSLFRWE